MNYFLPVNSVIAYNDKFYEYQKEDVENVITQQIIISQLSNGITYKDTEYMDSYERVFIYKKLIQMKKDENDAKIKAIEEAKKNAGLKN